MFCFTAYLVQGYNQKSSDNVSTKTKVNEIVSYYNFVLNLIIAITIKIIT